MSTNQPPQGPGQAGQPGEPANPHQQGQPAGSWAAPVTEPRPSKGRRRGVTIGVVGVVAAALVVGAGVFAWAKLSGGGPQPSEAIPSDAVAYMRLDLDPSAEQKLNAVSLLQKWPGFEDVTGISDDEDDLRKVFVDKFLSTDECGVDYEDDIEPWVGHRLGFAVVPGEDAPAPLAAVQVTDEAEAEAGVEKLEECLDDEFGMSPMSGSSYGQSAPAADEPLGVAFSGEYMLLAENQDLADEYAADAEQESLASSEQFGDDMDALGDEGLASLWYDANAMIDMAEEMGAPADAIESLKSQDLGSGAAAIRAGDDYLELASASTSGVGAAGEPSRVDELPASTLAAVSISGGQALVDRFWSQLEDMSRFDPSTGTMLEGMETESGLSMPDDLGTLLGDQAMLALDGEGLDPQAMPQQVSDLNAGIRLTGDPDEIRSVLDKLGGTAQSALDQLVVEDTDDGVVIASNDGYASTLTEGGGDLGDDEKFTTAVPEADDAVNVVYVDLDRIGTLAAAMGEDIDPIGPMEAFGLSTYEEGDHTHMSARLTFN